METLALLTSTIWAVLAIGLHTRACIRLIDARSKCGSAECAALASVKINFANAIIAVTVCLVGVIIV